MMQEGDQYQSFVSAYGANKDQIKVLLSGISRYSNRKKAGSMLESKLYKRKGKKRQKSLNQDFNQLYSQLHERNSVDGSLPSIGIDPVMNVNKSQHPIHGHQRILTSMDKWNYIDIDKTLPPQGGDSQ